VFEIFETRACWGTASNRLEDFLELILHTLKHTRIQCTSWSLLSSYSHASTTLVCDSTQTDRRGPSKILHIPPQHRKRKPSKTTRLLLWFILSKGTGWGMVVWSKLNEILSWGCRRVRNILVWTGEKMRWCMSKGEHDPALFIANRGQRRSRRRNKGRGRGR
jgi:hypothetical protein